MGVVTTLEESGETFALLESDSLIATEDITKLHCVQPKFLT